MTNVPLTRRARDLFKGRTDGKMAKVTQYGSGDAIMLRVSIFLGNHDAEAADALEELHGIIERWQFERDQDRVTAAGPRR